MSYERAAVNCQRCYILGIGIIDGSDKNTSRIQIENDIARDDVLYRARNEAMKALENTRSAGIANTGLESCLKCDFKSPGIIDILKKFKKL